MVINNKYSTKTKWKIIEIYKKHNAEIKYYHGASVKQKLTSI